MGKIRKRKIKKKSCSMKKRKFGENFKRTQRETRRVLENLRKSYRELEIPPST